MNGPVEHPLRYAVQPDAPAAHAARHPCIDRPFTYPAELVWQPADPWAVQLRFPTLTWIIGYDLLERGLVMPAGAWDVRIRPVPGDRIEIVLDSNHGQAVLHLRAGDVRRFVEAVGERWAPVRIRDAELAEWLAEAER